MVGNAYQVQSTQQKPRAQRTENSRYFMRLLSKTHLEIQTDSVADTFSLLMLFECQWGETWNVKTRQRYFMSVYRRKAINCVCREREGGRHFGPGSPIWSLSVCLCVVPGPCLSLTHSSSHVRLAFLRRPCAGNMQHSLPTTSTPTSAAV